MYPKLMVHPERGEMEIYSDNDLLTYAVRGYKVKIVEKVERNIAAEREALRKKIDYHTVEIAKLQFSLEELSKEQATAEVTTALARGEIKSREGKAALGKMFNIPGR